MGVSNAFRVAFLMLVLAGAPTRADMDPIARARGLLETVGVSSNVRVVAVASRPPNVSDAAIAFVVDLAPPVWVVSTSLAYRRAGGKGDARGLAAVIAHELIHAAGERSEVRAYAEQLRTLLLLRAPESDFHEARDAMQRALKETRRINLECPDRRT